MEQYFHLQWKMLWNNTVFVIPQNTYKLKSHYAYAKKIITNQEHHILHCFHYPSRTIFILLKDNMIYIKTIHDSYCNLVEIIAYDIIERMLSIIYSKFVIPKIYYVKYDKNKLTREVATIQFTNAPYLTSYKSYLNFYQIFIENNIMSILMLAMHEWHIEFAKYGENAVIELGEWIITDRFLLQQICKY
jgi:hypothetical protein